MCRRVGIVTAILVLFSLFYIISCKNDTTDMSYEITVSVSNSTYMGEDVIVTSFESGGNIPDDEIETVSSILSISDGDATVTLNNAGAGYADGIYGLRAHIDIDGDGELTSGGTTDYICIGEVTVNGSDATAVLNGPWGTYDTFIVINAPLPGDVDGLTDMMYLIVVAQGHTWGNYTYGYTEILSAAGAPSVRFWAPDGTYDFHAMIDVGNDSPGVPDSGDYVYSNTDIDYSGGTFPSQTISSWTSF
jgi:hypothetical protein